MNPQRLQVIIEAENKMNAALNDAGSSLDTFRSKIDDLQPAFKNMQKYGAIAFAAIAGVGVKAFKDFADAEAETALATNTLETTLKRMSADTLNEMTEGATSVSQGLEYMTKTMEAQSKAAIQLGFDDETAATAFSKLFSASGDTTQAVEQMSLAMDLARFSGRDLESATDALIKVHAGGTRVLKEFGIDVEEGTSAVDAFRIVQERTAGAAQTFADSSAGAMERVSVQMGNMSEAIGGALAPALEQLLAKVEPVVTKVLEWIEENPKLTGYIIAGAAAIAGLVAVVGTLGILLPAIITGFTLMLGPVGLVILAIAALVAGGVLLYKNWDKIKAKTMEIWGSIKEYINGVIESIKTKFGDAYTSIMDWINKMLAPLNNIIELAKRAFGIGNNALTFTGGSILKLVPARAAGGPVSAGSPYIVGERGPELFVPTRSGSIVPNGGGGITINITGNTLLDNYAAEKIGNQLMSVLKQNQKL